MHIQNNVPLSTLTTMHLGGIAREVATFSNKSELEEIISYAHTNHLPFFVIGGGSNIIAKGEEYPGIILLSKMEGFKTLDEDDEGVTLRIGAGEKWDNVVKRTVDMGLSGIEAMSGIPGTTGATPVQNVGAYGQEIANTLVQLEAFDTENEEWVTLDKDACHFAYRNSIFKDPSKRHHIITSVTLRLNKTTMQPPFYESLQRYIDSHNITDYSPASIREAVLAVRSNRLPDPSVIPNTGSFFKNPIVSKEVADKILETYPDMPHFPLEDGTVKLVAGWIMERSGLKGYSAHGMRTYQENALVVVNDCATTYRELEQFMQEIIEKVYEKFGVRLEQEPETLSAPES